MTATRRLRVLFIFPYDTTYRHIGGAFGRNAVYTNLTFSTLAAVTPDDIPVDYTYIDEGVEDPRGTYQKDWDVVGISLTTSNTPRGYRLAAYFRSRSIPVVIGGAHPTLVPGEADEHADVVVRGAGEGPWIEILREIAETGVPDPGVRHGGRLGQRLGAFPDRSLVAGKAYMRYPTMMASRGCRNGCSFCTTSAMWRNSGPRPVADVMDEVRMLTRAKRAFIFMDSNLVMDREFALELFRELEPLKLRWGGLVTSDFMFDGELVEAAERAGCLGVLIGLESVNQTSLDGCRKSFNEAQRYVEGIANLHAHGIGALATMVVGFDHDGPDTFEHTVEFVNEAGVDTIHYTVLTPFPGTALFSQLDAEGRILTRDWSKYDTINVVYQPKLLTPEELRDGYRYVWRETYRPRNIARRLRGVQSDLLLKWGLNFTLNYHARALARCYENQDDLMLGGVS